MKGIIFGSRSFEKIIETERVIVTTKLQSLGQSPYFAVSGESRSKYAGRNTDCRSSGQIQWQYMGHFPTLEPYYIWHLVSFDEPMHYVANTTCDILTGKSGGYHPKNGKGMTVEECFESAEKTAKWGVLPGEIPGTMVDTILNSGIPMEVFLKNRLPLLMAKFEIAMHELFGKDTVAKALDYHRELKQKQAAKENH